MKTFYVADQYGQKHEVKAKSVRQAVAAVCVQYYGYNSPKLQRIFVDGAGKDEGKIFHVGYVCGRYWFRVAELTFMRQEVKS